MQVGAMVVAGLLLASSAASHTEGFKFYSFFDMEAEVSDKNADGRRWTFDQHRLDEITMFETDSRFPVLTEVDCEHGPCHLSGETCGDLAPARQGGI